MTVLRGDCIEVMAGMEPDSIDAIVTDPPYGIGFMGHQWDQPGEHGPVRGGPGHCPGHPRTREARRRGEHVPDAMEVGRYDLGRTAMVRYQDWCATWGAAMLRVARPGAYAVVAGGPRTVHRLTSGLEDAGWLIRDVLVWAHAQGFPKSRSCLKPAWEPIVLARKPGPLRELNIGASRIGDLPERTLTTRSLAPGATVNRTGEWHTGETITRDYPEGRWPANVVLTDPVFDGGWEGVVGGGVTDGGGVNHVLRRGATTGKGMGYGSSSAADMANVGYDDTGTYSRFFLIPKAPRSERVLSDGRRSPHPTQKPEALIRHLVRLVVPEGGVVLDPFLGSGTLGVVCDGLGVRWVGIERDAEYAQWADDRIADGRPRWATSDEAAS